MFEESIKERIHVLLKWSLLIGSFQMEPPDWLERIHVNLKWSLLIGCFERSDKTAAGLPWGQFLMLNMSRSRNRERSLLPPKHVQLDADIRVCHSLFVRNLVFEISSFRLRLKGPRLILSKPKPSLEPPVPGCSHDLYIPKVWETSQAGSVSTSRTK